MAKRDPLRRPQIPWDGKCDLSPVTHASLDVAWADDLAACVDLTASRRAAFQVALCPSRRARLLPWSCFVGKGPVLPEGTCSNSSGALDVFRDHQPPVRLPLVHCRHLDRRHGWVDRVYFLGRAPSSLRLSLGCLSTRLRAIPCLRLSPYHGGRPEEPCWPLWPSPGSCLELARGPACHAARLLLTASSGLALASSTDIAHGPLSPPSGSPQAWRSGCGRLPQISPYEAGRLWSTFQLDGHERLPLCRLLPSWVA